MERWSQTDTERDREMETDNNREIERRRDKDINRKGQRDKHREMEHVPCPALPLVRGPHTSAPSPTEELASITLRPLRKKRKPPGCVPRGDFHPQGAGRECVRTQRPEGSFRVESGDGDGPHPELPFLPAPRPHLLPRAPPAQPPPPMPLWPVPPGPSGGLAVLRALPPTPHGGKHIPPCVTSLHGLPRGPDHSPPPLPSLLTVYSHFLPAPRPARTPTQLPH